LTNEQRCLALDTNMVHVMYIWRYCIVIVIRKSPCYLYVKSPCYLYGAIAL